MLRKIYSELRHDALRSTRYYQRFFPTLGIACAVAFPAFYLVEFFLGALHYDSLWIRLGFGLYGSLLYFTPKVPKHLQPYVSVYWIFGITLVFPFGYGVLLVLNAAFTPLNQETHILWVCQYMVALFIFVQHANSLWLASVLWILASFAALLPLAFLDQYNFEQILELVFYPASLYFTIVVLGSLTNRNLEMVRNEKIAVLTNLGRNIAHELRTPLASIGGTALGAKGLFPQLVAAYEKQLELDPPSEPISQQQLAMLSQTLEFIQKEVEYSNTIIDMLLVNAQRPETDPAAFEEVKISDCVHAAMARFPFNNEKERSLVSIKLVTDFVVSVPPILFEHVIFNLVKNALLFAQKKTDGTVTLIIDEENHTPVLHVVDTGPGITSTQLPFVFEPFYTTHGYGEGTGVGLSFCKLVVEQIGGEISCQSEPTVETKFSVRFPKRRCHSK